MIMTWLLTWQVVAALAPFADLGNPEMQAMLRRDIGRRYAELLALGWLGRAYNAAPALFDKLGVFRLESIGVDGSTCTLKESSIVKRGVPIRVTLPGAEVVGFGCDVASGEPAREALVVDPPTKRLVVRAITRTIFTDLAGVGAALMRDAALERCGPELSFEPRRDFWALEGTSEKWLQNVAGYYFAASRLQYVRFADGPDVRFLFYFDPTEPVNSEDPTRNVNPEVIFCQFRDFETSSRGQ